MNTDAAQPSEWDSLTPFQRNQLVGDRLGMEPLTQCWIGFAGKMLLRTKWTEAQRSEAEAMCRLIQMDRLWEDSLRDYPSLRPEMRGKLEVMIDRWHIRYFETPGGGWDVIEWLRQRGRVVVESLGAGWVVTLQSASWTFQTCADTMADAACRTALRVRQHEIENPKSKI